MSHTKQTNRESGQPEIGPGPRKPYRKPALRYERVFEMQALSCGKTVATQGQCLPGNQKTS